MPDIVVSDIAAQAITAAIIAQTASNEKLWGSPGLLVPTSPISILKKQADATSDMAAMLASISGKQKDLEGSLTAIRGAISNVSAGVHAGVTTHQIAVTDQINNNKFNQTTTNAALKRSDLPPTVVTTGDLLTTTKETITNVTQFKGQIYAANLVEEQIRKAATWGTDIVNDVIKDSFIGSAAKDLQNIVKGWFAKDKVAEKVVETKAQTRSGELLSVPLPTDTSTYIA